MIDWVNPQKRVRFGLALTGSQVDKNGGLQGFCKSERIAPGVKALVRAVFSAKNTLAGKTRMSCNRTVPRLLPFTAVPKSVQKTKRKIIKKNLSIARWLALAALAFLTLKLSTAQAQGTTAFTYQGQLRDGGTNANGVYTMIFALYDSATSTNHADQIGSAITTSATLANGLFSVNLDFGAGAFNGSARWLDITVQCGSDCETLAPRVLVLPAPYALFASTANTANNLNVNDGSVTLTKAFPPYGTSSWNIQNAYCAIITNSVINGNSTNFQGALAFVGGSGLPAMQIWDDPQSGTQGVSSSNFIGGRFFGDGSGLTNLTRHGITNFEAGTYTFTIPPGVTQLYIEAWGGGGGGGTDNGEWGWSGAGGTGGYARGFIEVKPLTNYTVQVGNGGMGGVGEQTDGQAGGDTFFADPSNINNPLFICGGGSGGGDGFEGEGGAADPHAGIQRPGMYACLAQSGTVKPVLNLFTFGLQYVPPTYGQGGNFFEDDGSAMDGIGGCIVIQW
jgi:hypothetical protein